MAQIDTKCANYTFFKNSVPHKRRSSITICYPNPGNEMANWKEATLATN